MAAILKKLKIALSSLILVRFTPFFRQNARNLIGNICRTSEICEISRENENTRDCDSVIAGDQHSIRLPLAIVFQHAVRFRNPLSGCLFICSHPRRPPTCPSYDLAYLKKYKSCQLTHILCYFCHNFLICGHII